MSDLPTLVIQPSKGWVAIRLGELWQYRELLYFLTWRDVKIRYKQTVLGASWALLQPLLTMLIFTLIFGRVAKIPTGGVPYPLFALVGLAPWTFFAYGLSQSSNSLVASANMLKKVYFPRLAIPLSSVCSGAVDFGIVLGLLAAMMAWYRVPLNPTMLWIPAFVLLAFVASFGVGLWLSALNVQYRDVRYVVPFLLQFWMYATPIAYPMSALHEPWRTLLALNPMTGVVEGFRWALLGSARSSGPLVAISMVVALVVLVTGAFYFRRMERTFADVV